MSWNHFPLAKRKRQDIANGDFDKIDKLASPRLVEYWEQDPCAPEPPRREMMKSGWADLRVTTEAQFTAGEYEVVTLNARDSVGLDRSH